MNEKEVGREITRKGKKLGKGVEGKEEKGEGKEEDRSASKTF